MKEKLGPHCKGIKQNYFTIFFENSKAKRINFFQQPLIQELWSMYRTQCKNDFSEYFQRVKISELGQVKLQKLLKNAN